MSTVAFEVDVWSFGVPLLVVDSDSLELGKVNPTKTLGLTGLCSTGPVLASFTLSSSFCRFGCGSRSRAATVGTGDRRTGDGLGAS